MHLLSKLKQRARKLSSEAQVLMIAYKDTRSPVLAKIVIGLTVAYLLSPIDLIPDFIPILGLLDDLVIVPALVVLSIKLIPQIVLEETRKQLENNPQRYKKNSWLFAVVIIAIWIFIVYNLFARAKHLWK